MDGDSGLEEVVGGLGKKIRGGGGGGVLGLEGGRGKPLERINKWEVIR